MSRVAEQGGRIFDWEGARVRLERARRALDETLEPLPEDVERVLRERARALAAPPTTVATTPAGALEVLRFRAAGEHYAVEARHLLEIRAAEELVLVPQTPTFILGVVNVRGQILTVVDVPALLGSVGGSVADRTRFVVLGASGATFALAADAVEGLGELVVASPAPGGAEHGALVRGVSSELVTLLDLEAFVADARFIVEVGA